MTDQERRDRFEQLHVAQLQQQLSNVTLMLVRVMAERDLIGEGRAEMMKQNAELIAELATLKQPSA